MTSSAAGARFFVFNSIARASGCNSFPFEIQHVRKERPQASPRPRVSPSPVDFRVVHQPAMRHRAQGLDDLDIRQRRRDLLQR
jgi:hypothetical protein